MMKRSDYTDKELSTILNKALQLSCKDNIRKAFPSTYIQEAERELRKEGAIGKIVESKQTLVVQKTLLEDVVSELFTDKNYNRVDKEYTVTESALNDSLKRAGIKIKKDKETR